MANPAESEVQNLLPVQAYFNVDGSFNTFIGQNKPFYATPDPQQSGLQITNSTINSSVIGGITPAAGNFTTATVLTQPVGATDVVNLLALQSYAAGISWKQPCVAATLTNITLSGLQTIDGHPVTAGNRVLVKNQSTAANNGIYLASASTWTRSEDANSWDELICAITFIEYGTQAGGAWFCTAQDGGTLGVTAVNWSQFTTSATYSAGTGLTLTGTVFSITPVGTASTYGSASTVPVFTTNASGQVSSVTNTNIAIAATQITSGTIDSARLSGSYSGITGLGTLTDLTVTNPIVGSITGNAATATLATSATSATTATNIGGGAAGSVPYQTASSTTGFLAAGTNGQVLTLASGVPSWATPTTGTVTSVSGTGTVSGISLSGTVTSTGSLTLGGTLDLSSPPAIGGTAPNTGAFTTLTSTNDATIHGLIVGKGGGAVSNNTVLGVTALDSNTTGQQNVAVGINALTTATTANNQTAVGYQALRLSTASDNTAVGSTALQANSTGGGNVAMGFQALTANTTGGSNTAVGRHALITNSTGSNLTALGNHAGAYETGSNALYIDAIDRTNTAGDKAGALLYGTFNANPANQTLAINASVTIPYQLRIDSTLSLAGSTGTSGHVLTSNGASAPTWQALPATGLGIVDDTTTNATRYITFTSATSGNITTENVSSTKLQFNPSTGILSSTGFAGALNGTVGASTASTGAFTTLSASGVATFSAGTVSAPAITTTGDTNTGIFFPAADTIAFSEGGVESMRIDSSGNVCVGTATALSTAANRGNVTINGSSGSILALGVGGSSKGYLYQDSSSMYLVNAGNGDMIFENNTAERLRIEAGGNIQLADTTLTQGRWRMSSNGAGGFGGWTLATYNGGFNTAATVDGNGNFLVGRTSQLASEKFVISQSANATGLCVASNSGPNIGNYESSDITRNAWWTFGRDNQTTGNFIFAYNGSAVASINLTTGIYTALSDARLKKNITDLNYGLNEVLALRPVSYLMNKEEDTAKKHIGFIAQEVKSIMDETVDDLIDEETQFYGLDKSGLVPVLVKAIQEQQTLIQNLTNRLNALEGK